MGLALRVTPCSCDDNELAYYGTMVDGTDDFTGFAAELEERRKRLH